MLTFANRRFHGRVGRGPGLCEHGRCNRVCLVDQSLKAHLCVCVGGACCLMAGLLPRSKLVYAPVDFLGNRAGGLADSCVKHEMAWLLFRREGCGLSHCICLQ